MVIAPAFNHLPLHLVVFLSIVSSSPARPPIKLHSLFVKSPYSAGPFVGATGDVDDEAGMSINASMNIEAPRSQLLISINVPECI